MNNINTTQILVDEPSFKIGEAVYANVVDWDYKGSKLIRFDSVTYTSIRSAIFDRTKKEWIYKLVDVDGEFAEIHLTIVTPTHIEVSEIENN